MANLNLNKVILGGRLTADPEIKSTTSGTAVLNFTVAINRKTKDEKADFINCVAFKERAEIIGKYFHKGSCICIVGELQTRTWEDSSGSKRYATEVIVSEVNFVDSKGETATKPVMPNAPAKIGTAGDNDFEEIDSLDGIVPF